MSQCKTKTHRQANRRAGRAASGLSRRSVLAGGAAASSLAACGGGGGGGAVDVVQAPAPTPVPTATPAPTGSGVHPILGTDAMNRQTEALNLRVDAAYAQADASYGVQTTNGDEGLYADYRASYSKGLPHDGDGLVDRNAFDSFLRALDTGENNDFEAIPLGGARRLANPQAAYRFELAGLDSHKTVMRPAPAFAGDECAAEMGELYWKALCRDVPFADYDTSPLISDAVADLNAFAATVGAVDRGALSTATVFRGETAGDLQGPYISQFLLRDVPYGNTRIEQRYDVPAGDADYMTDHRSWLDVQNGVAPAPLVKGNRRFISDARALGEYVHVDYTYQAYLNAALILLGMPGTFDAGNAYNSSATQGGFATLGGPDVLDLVGKAGNLALTGAWYQKWLVHRRARPEVYGARLHAQIANGVDYGLPTDIADCEGVRRCFQRHGTYYLPQAYPEGSPTHPSYPAGHATIAGACCTVLKAFFEESFELQDNVMASRLGERLDGYAGTLTVGGEIDKLANNIALGRDWAGVHYRSDGVDGLRVGEQQAIGLLLDYSRTYREPFDGWTLRTFDGETITIKAGGIV